MLVERTLRQGELLDWRSRPIANRHRSARALRRYHWHHLWRHGDELHIICRAAG